MPPEKPIKYAKYGTKYGTKHGTKYGAQRNYCAISQTNVETNAGSNCEAIFDTI